MFAFEAELPEDSSKVDDARTNSLSQIEVIGSAVWSDCRIILTPQGRTQPGDSTRIHQAVGWVMSELETNNASRLSLPSESVLDKQCIAVASSFWRAEGWRSPCLS